MKESVKIIIISVVLISLAACSGYEKTLKSSDYKLKYREGLRYYKDGNYVRSATLLDQIAVIFRGTDQADSVYFYQAMSYFNQNDYIMSGHYFRTFSATYGGSPFVEEADFMSAYCYYLSSPRPSLEQTSTVSAIQAFQLFLIRHPASAKKDQCISYIDELRNKLVEKSYISAKLYFDLEDYKAATVALNNSLVQYPESKYREEIMFMLVKSRYLFAENSIFEKQKERYQNSIDEYYSFAAEFPESKFIKEAVKYYKTSSRFLGVKIDDENKQEKK